MIFLLLIYLLPVLALIGVVILGLVGLAKGGLRGAMASGGFAGAGVAVGMFVFSAAGWFDWLAGGPTRTTRNWFELIVLVAGPIVPLVWRVAMRRLPTLRHIAVGIAAVAILVLAGSIPDTIDQRSWVAMGSATGDAGFRYDRRHNVLVVDLRRDWDYNSQRRLGVACGDAHGDRRATGSRRTVMHLDGTSLALDAVGECKVLDPHMGLYENDLANRAFLHRADV